MRLQLGKAGLMQDGPRRRRECLHENLERIAHADLLLFGRPVATGFQRKRQLTKGQLDKTTLRHAVVAILPVHCNPCSRRFPPLHADGKTPYALSRPKLHVSGSEFLGFLNNE